LKRKKVRHLNKKKDYIEEKRKYDIEGEKRMILYDKKIYGRGKKRRILKEGRGRRIILNSYILHILNLL